MAGNPHSVTRLHPHHGRGQGATALDRILDAALDLARAEAAGVQLGPDEQTILDCCNQIAGLRDIAADETGQPVHRDRDAPTDPEDAGYDF